MIMIDLEGTLTDHSRRLATLLENEEKYKKRDRTAWKEYYKGLIDDPPRPHIMDLVHEWISEDLRPIVYSTRFVNKYNHEEQWLRRHDLFDKVELLLRPSHETKIKGPELILKWVKEREPEIVVDDRDEVRDLLRGSLPRMMVYHPNAFLDTNAGGDFHGHSLR